MPRYAVRLTEAERQQLDRILAKGSHPASTATRARWRLKLLAQRLVELKQGMTWLARVPNCQ